MEAFVDKLQKDYPDIAFVEGKVAYWSSETRTVIYTRGSEAAVWSALHELGHGLLGHTSYVSDAVLLQKETAAWVKARELAAAYSTVISAAYIEDCLDTYRDWLHKRSTCPNCGAQGLQESQLLYACFNCQAAWKVTRHRFCRPYRLKTALIHN